MFDPLFLYLETSAFSVWMRESPSLFAFQHNKQASTFSSNIRLALLNAAPAFLVYNDRRDTSSFTLDELLGRSFIVKYTRLFDY
jgi:hypothetical protein